MTLDRSRLGETVSSSINGILSGLLGEDIWTGLKPVVGLCHNDATWKPEVRFIINM